jgi:predicted phage-related endonuclease
MKYPPNYLVDIQQNTPEWLIERIGSVTASRVKDAVATLKRGGESAARASYKLELLTEILTGRAFEHYVSQAMDFGTENEPLARGAYEISRGVEVERIGYIRHPSIPRSGASPDGLVGEDGLVEFKVPNTTTHLSYLLLEDIPDEYIPQLNWQLACSGRKWVDFVSYDPRLPEDFGLFIERHWRNGAVIAALEQRVIEFIAELNEMGKKLQKRGSLVSKLQDSIRAAGPPKAEIPSFQ